MKLSISKTQLSRIARAGLALAVLAGMVWAQEQSVPQKQGAVRYIITDLGTLGGPFSEALDVNNNGLVSGVATLTDGTEHTFLWQKGVITDIGTPGLGGSNSAAVTVNERGEAAGPAETTTPDPNGEDFCRFGTHLVCLPFLWQNGMMTSLPTLGGNNGAAVPINNRGQVAGVAENSNRDSNCAVPFQVLDFEAVIWGPEPGQIQELHPLVGDSVGQALWINDAGQAVGSSGSCANSLPPPVGVGPHAVLWEKDGSVHDLGNLGGTCLVLCESALLGPFGNTALEINNQGQVVGLSALPGDTTFHAFLWTSETGMQDLGTLPGDVASGAFGINDRGDVVGLSLDASGNPRAFLRQNGVMTDLSTLIPTDSPLLPFFAEIINSREEIVGLGVDTSTGNVHGFLATPVHSEVSSDRASVVQGGTSRTKATLSENARKQVQRRLRFRPTRIWARWAAMTVLLDSSSVAAAAEAIVTGIVQVSGSIQSGGQKGEGNEI